MHASLTPGMILSDKVLKNCLTTSAPTQTELQRIDYVAVGYCLYALVQAQSIVYTPHHTDLVTRAYASACIALRLGVVTLI